MLKHWSLTELRSAAAPGLPTSTAEGGAAALGSSSVVESSDPFDVPHVCVNHPTTGVGATVGPLLGLR